MATDGTGNVITERAERLLESADRRATLVSDMWTKFYTCEERARWRRSVRETYDYVYATDTSETSNSQNPHSHNTHRPKLYQIVATLSSLFHGTLFPSDAWCQFVPLDVEAANQNTRRKLELFIQNRHLLNGFVNSTDSLLMDYLLEGNCFARVEYTTKEAGREQGISRYGYSGPVVTRIQPNRVAFNTQANSFEDSWKIVQSIKTEGDIARMLADDTVSEEYRQILSDSMHLRHQMRTSPAGFAEDFREAGYAGFGNNLTYWGNGDSVEILTFYGDIYDEASGELAPSRMVTVIDRMWVLEDVAIDTWDGKPMLRHAGCITNPNTLLAMGPVANLTGLQYQLNHLHNSKADAFDKMIYPDRIYNNVEDRVDNPDGSTDYFCHDGGSIQNLAPDTTILSADMQIQAIERSMEEFAGVPPESMGLKTPGEQTRFEVSERLTAASRLFQSRVRSFEKNMLEPLVNDELELSKRHMDESLEIGNEEGENILFDTITPENLRRRGVFVAKGATHYSRQQQMVGELQGFMAALQQDPAMAAHFPPDRLAKAWDSVMGNMGSTQGLYQKFGRIAESVEAQQESQVAGQQIDDSAAAMQQLNQPQDI